VDINESRLDNQLLDEKLMDKLYNLVMEDIGRISGTIIEKNNPATGKKQSQLE